MRDTATVTAPGRTRITVFVGSFLGLWTAAWLLRLALGGQLPAGADLGYWVLAKTLVWGVFPAAFWWGRLPGGQAAFIGLRLADARRGLLVGGAFAVGWLLVLLAWTLPGGLRVAAAPAGTAALTAAYAVLLTPLLEELFFRGYLQSTLVATGVRFAYVNLVGATLFLGVHVLGWAFQGALGNLLTPYPVSIFLLSLLFGYVRHRSGSLLAAILLHTANNAFSTFVKG